MNKGRKPVRLRTKPDNQEEATMKKPEPLKRERVADWKQLTVRVPPEVHRALRIRAAEEGRSCAVIVEGLIRQYLLGRTP